MLAAISTLWVGSAYGEPAELASANEECMPTALLHGEGEVVTELGLELNLLGVSTREAKKCPMASAHVERGAGGVVVSLREPSGQRATRTLSNARIAATWIDSWLQEDLRAPLLAARLLPQRSAVAVQRSPRPPLLAKAQTRAVPARRYQASVAYESRYPSGPSWTGLRAGVCVSVGFACIGGQATIASSSDETIEEANYEEFSRSSASLVANLIIPIDIGQATLRPSLGLGASRMTTERTTTLTCVGVPETGVCDDDIETERSTWAPTAEVGVSASLPLARSLRVEFGGSLSVRPLGKAAEKLRLDDSPPPCADPTNPFCDDIVDPAGAYEIVVMPRDQDQSWQLYMGLLLEL